MTKYTKYIDPDIIHYFNVFLCFIIAYNVKPVWLAIIIAILYIVIGTILYHKYEKWYYRKWSS